MGELRWTKTVGSAEITKLSVGSMDNNVYVIASGNQAVVVDAGSNECDYVVTQLGGRKLDAVLQTHNHGDHVVTLKEIVDATGAVVFGNPEDQLPVPIDHEVSDGSTVKGPGGLTFRVLHTPGHTPGSVCFVLEEGGETHVFAGDTLFPGGPGNTWGKPELFEQIMGSLDTKLFVLPDDAHIYPGHGDDTTIGTERPSVEEWRARGH